MLFEPGSRSVPAARVTGGRSRSLARYSLEAPRRGAAQPSACARALRASVMSRSRPGPSPLLDQLAEHGEARAVAVDLLEQRVAVLQRDVAPHLGRARGDAREVAKAPGGEAEQLGGVVARGDLGDEREGEQVRQVAHRGEDAVVRGGVQRDHARAARLPAAAHEVDGIAARSPRRA